MKPTPYRLLVVASFSVMLLALPMPGCAEEKSMHRLVTFIRGEEEVQGFWSFCWDDDVRKTLLVLRGGDGAAIELEQEISMRPILTMVATLGRVKDDPLLRLEVQYPSVIASNLVGAGDSMVAGEPVALSLSIQGEERREATTTVPEDQTEEYVSLVRSLVAPESLSNFVPSELRGLIQTLTEVAGPHRQLKGGDPDTYSLAFGLLGALDSRPGASETTAGAWTIVENPKKIGATYDEEEQAFLASVGKILVE